MRKPQFPDVVRLTAAIPEHGLAAGDLGTILDEYEVPDEAYGVEFSNEYGETTAMLALKPFQFEVAFPLGRVPEKVST